MLVCIDETLQLFEMRLQIKLSIPLFIIIFYLIYMANYKQINGLWMRNDIFTHIIVISQERMYIDNNQ